MKRRIATGVAIVTALFLVQQLTALAAPSTAPAPQAAKAQLGLIQAVLVALGYWFTSSAFNANMGFNIMRWPIIAGTIVGIIMGDMGRGILLGASINLVFLGVISAGGSSPADPALAGWLGTALAMSAGLSEKEAIAIAAPIGVIGLFGFFSRMSVDVAFVHRADAEAEKGNIKGVVFNNVVPGQIYVFLTTFIPVVVLALAGSAALDALFTAIDPFRGGSADWRWLRDWFIIAGSVLVAVGIGLNLNLILTPAMIPYMLIFFTVAALTKANIIALAVIAAGLAVMHVTLFRRRQNV
ncbi:MAG: PTS sugar transporter subunit IIC [Chloroflexi bacterium]|nr:PTS sugar transporter subunit IIC [Chloroflexota bacterium]MBI3732460.1 PTS sugar transporter subunit IIC [Chloroflexota bacterium]